MREKGHYAPKAASNQVLGVDGKEDREATEKILFTPAPEQQCTIGPAEAE